MIDHSINYAEMSIFEGCVKCLELHADIYGGQNKNKYMLWYLLCRVNIHIEDEITLNLLVEGHTKSRCDGDFGLVKRKLKGHNEFSPAERRTFWCALPM